MTTPPLPRRFQLSKERFRPDTRRMEELTRKAHYYNPPAYARALWHLDQLRPAMRRRSGPARLLFRVILQFVKHERHTDHARGRGVPR